MKRYVLFSRRPSPDQDDLDTILSAEGVRVLDRTVVRAMLVEAEAVSIESLKNSLRDWVIAPEVEHPRPDPIKRATRKP